MMTGPSPRARLLAEPAWLAAHLDDPQVRVVDMRGFVRTVSALTRRTDRKRHEPDEP